MFALGWQPDPDKLEGQTPDFDASERLGAGAVLTSASNRHLVVDILNQGGLGSCTTNATGQAIRASHVGQIGSALIAQGASFDDAFAQARARAKLTSRLFLYYLARAYEHMTDVDAGTYIRLVFDSLNRFGFCSEDVWTYDDAIGPGAKFTRMPSPEAFREAFDQKSPTVYHKIFETGYARVDAVKRAIAQGHLVAFGTQVSNDFCQGNFDPTKPLPPPTGLSIAGGHAMCFAEYVGDDFGVPNSWGTTFGVDGWVRFSADYVAWDQTRDLWIVEASPLYS